MDESEVEKDLPGVHLDNLGQTERINSLYTQITFCFPIRIDGTSSPREIVDNLERALTRLGIEFPWVTGKVIKNDDGFKILPAETSPRLVTKQLQDDASVPTWDELKHANFPFRMLNEDVVAPCKTMLEPDTDRPVLLVQANFVKGGFLLTFNAQHGSMDMAGQGQVITLFAKACRGEDFTKDEVVIGNMQRENRIPIPDNKGPTQFDSSKSKPPGVVQDSEGNAKPRQVQPSMPSDALLWAYLDFTSASLSRLKELASRALSSEVTFVSTDDVLTAFIWQSITRARQPRLGSPRLMPTTLTRNVDVRRHFDLPPTYPGMMTTATSHTYAVDDLVNQKPLGYVASGLRTALSRDSLRSNTVNQATAIARNKDAAAQRSVAVLSDPTLDVRLSSWAKEKLYDLDFGPCLGQPEAVRRPMFMHGAREGLVYFLPKDRDGGIMVGISLRQEDMERLRTDDVVLRFSRWVG